MANGHAKRAVGEDARRSGHRGAVIDGVAKRPAGEHAGKAHIKRAAAERGSPRRICGDGIERIARGWNVNASERLGAGARRIPIKILSGGGSGNESKQQETEKRLRTDFHLAISPLYRFTPWNKQPQAGQMPRVRNWSSWQSKLRRKAGRARGEHP